MRKNCLQCRTIFEGPLRAKFCGTACYHASKPYTPEQREATFWSRVDNSGGPDACWPWTGAVTTHGYGCVQAGGRRVMGAHKMAYVYANGPVESGLEIRHSCDNPICCNPAHLSVGTKFDNMADKMARERWQKSNPRKLTANGKLHPSGNGKCTWEMPRINLPVAAVYRCPAEARSIGSG